MIAAAGHGGAVLIVPSETGEWLKTLDPFAYRFAVPDTTIGDVIRQQLKAETAQAQISQRLSQADVSSEIKNLVLGIDIRVPIRCDGTDNGVRATASLAGVDGAIVATQDLRTLGFGAKIVTNISETVKVSMVQLLGDDQELVPSPLEKLGGTRHQSAARFTAKNNSAIAIVVSQDRHVSVMHWHDESNSVAVLRNVEWLI